MMNQWFRSFAVLALLACAAVSQTIHSNPVGLTRSGISCAGVQQSIGMACSTPGFPYCGANMTRMGHVTQVSTGAWPMPLGSYVPVFAVEILGNPWPACWPVLPSGAVIPGGKPGCDLSFMSAPQLLAPQWTAQVNSGGVIFDAFWLDLALPSDPSFIGFVLSAQAMRVDPMDGLIYVSNRHDAAITT